MVIHVGNEQKNYFSFYIFFQMKENYDNFFEKELKKVFFENIFERDLNPQKLAKKQ